MPANAGIFFYIYNTWSTINHRRTPR